MRKNYFIDDAKYVKELRAKHNDWDIDNIIYAYQEQEINVIDFIVLQPFLWSQFKDYLFTMGMIAFNCNDAIKFLKKEEEIFNLIMPD